MENPSLIGIKTMPTSDLELKKIADLAYLALDATSSAQLSHDVSAMMRFVEQLCQVDTTHIAPLFHPLDLHQRLRIDALNDTNHEPELSKIAPVFAEGLYWVPKVIESGK